VSRRGLILAGALALAGCTVGPDFTPPSAPDATRYDAAADPAATVAAEGTMQRFAPETALPAEWWQLFRSPALDAMVKQGITDSPTVLSAEATLRQSEHLLRAGEGVFFPQIGADFSATRERATPQKLGQGGKGSLFNLFTPEATVSYTLDLFGGERRTVEALAADVEAQRNTARAAYLTLASNIVDTAVAAAAYRAEIDATEEIVTLQREQVKLAEVQATAGTAAYASVLSLEAQLEATEAQLPPLRQKLSQSEHLLAVLTGRLPAEWQPPVLGFADLTLPQDLPLSLPSALVRQRPDILEAEASMHDASAQIGVATAAMLPSITLDGAFGFSNTSAGSLFGTGGKFWSVGADVAQPIFEGGSLWYRRKAAVDAYDAAAANYRQAVLGAFQQVADTLRGLEHDAEALEAESRALDTAGRALKLVQANYAAGLATYAEVLIANAQYHQAQISDIQARASRFQDTVALFAALGGGWWNAPEQAEEQVLPHPPKA
jgi:NodT family efflux transporter outer membrane factor (OMF) lipoprotein